MKKVYLLCSVLIASLSLYSQISSVNLQAIHACNGATIIPFVVWNGTPNAVTIHYERQGAAATWFAVTSQVQTSNSHIVVSPTDISGATNYRVRVVDNSTFQEVISNGVVVNPANWNVARGVPNVILNSYWGTNCSNNENYINVSINYLTGGRPPFRVEYKKGTEQNYLVAGEAIGFINIMGIEPNTNYNVRVVDYCGNVTPVGNTQIRLLMDTATLQIPTTCNNGRIRINANGDARYHGVAPFEYGIGKVTTGLGGNVPALTYGTNNIFDALSPGEYYVRVRDACGNLSQLGFFRLGAGFPRLTATSSLASGDSCRKDITVTPQFGTGPLEYAIRYIQDPPSAWSAWQTSNVFPNLTKDGVYYIRMRDDCGQVSDDLPTNIGAFPKPVIDSVRHTDLPGCNQSITVHASGAYKPYEYGINIWHQAGNITWQTSNVFPNLPPNRYQLHVRDRCGRVSAFVEDTIAPKTLVVHTRTGFDSCGANTAFLSIDSIANGIAPYVYAIRNMAAPGNVYSPFGSDSIFSGLPPGEYSIWVKDACFAESIIDNIRVGSGMTYDFSLQPDLFGCGPLVVINLHNAVQGPFTYYITNGVYKKKVESADSSVIIHDLPNGVFTISVTNACGDSALNTDPPLEVTNSSAPLVTFEVRYVANCDGADIIVHGAPPGSLYQIIYESGHMLERSDSVFNAIDYNITGGKYVMVAYNLNACEGRFNYRDTVIVMNSTVVLTGILRPDAPDSLCIYNNTPVKLYDLLSGAQPGGTWTSTATTGFDAVNGTFTASQSTPGNYEFTYSITDACGSLHETSLFITVDMQACMVRAIAGDYQSAVQPNGCPVLPAINDWVHFTDNEGNLIFSLNPNGRELSTVCAGVRIVDGDGSTLRSTVIDGKMTFFLDRNFYIEVPNSADEGPVTVLLYFTDEEIQDMLTFLHNNGYPNAGVSDIRILQKSGDVDLQVTNEGALNPLGFVIITPSTGHNGRMWVMQFEVHNFSEFNPHFTGGTANLPLRLIDFTGANRPGKINLQWETTDENNTSHFDIERSSDGTHFNSIGRVNAAGSSTMERLYSFDDMQPLTGNNFYRLKMVDLDGKYTYSKIILLRSTVLTKLKITPNPVSDHLYVTTPGNIKAKAIRIYDATGRLLYQENVNGNQLLKVYTGNWRNGWYLLELETSTGSIREPFLK